MRSRKIYKLFINLFTCFFVFFLHSSSLKNIAKATGPSYSDYTVYGTTYDEDLVSSELDSVARVVSPKGLAWLAKLVNSGGLKNNITTVIIDNSIDISEMYDWPKIGTTEHPFDMELDGVGHSIIVDNNHVTSADYLGAIFGEFGENAKVKNLKVSLSGTEYAVSYQDSNKSESYSESDGSDSYSGSDDSTPEDSNTVELEQGENDSQYGDPLSNPVVDENFKDNNLDENHSNNNQQNSSSMFTEQKVVDKVETINGVEYTSYTDGTIETEANEGIVSFSVADLQNADSAVQTKVIVHVPADIFEEGTKIQVSVMMPSVSNTTVEKTPEQKAKEEKIAKKLDDKQKKLLETGKLMVFSFDAVKPNGEKYAALDKPITVDIQIDESMANGLKVVCISGDKVEEIETKTFQDANGVWFAKLILTHLSDYAMYNKEDEEKLENEEDASDVIKVENNHPDWGEYRRINGIDHWIDGNGTTSVEITGNNVIWLKEDSDNTYAWYGLDNSKGIFEKGSKFWVRWLSNKDVEWENYLNKLDNEHKVLAANGKLWIFLTGVTAPNGNEYEKFRDSVSFFVQLGSDWDEKDINAVFVSDEFDEPLEAKFVDDMRYPGGTGRFAVLTMKHFSPYVVYEKSEKPNELINSYNEDIYSDGQESTDITSFSGTSSNSNTSENKSKADSIAATKTGENNCIKFMIASMIMSLLLVFALSKKKSD